MHRRGLSLLLVASLVIAGSASRDITDIPGILSDIKTSLTTLPTESDFENAYQQYAELLAPVSLLMAGGSFEVGRRFLCVSFLTLHIAPTWTESTS